MSAANHDFERLMTLAAAGQFNQDCTSGNWRFDVIEPGSFTVSCGENRIAACEDNQIVDARWGYRTEGVPTSEVLTAILKQMPQVRLDAAIIQTEDCFDALGYTQHSKQISSIPGLEDLDYYRAWVTSKPNEHEPDKTDHIIYWDQGNGWCEVLAVFEAMTHEEFVANTRDKYFNEWLRDEPEEAISQSAPARIICDTYDKRDKYIWGENPNTEFNRKILAVNDMYGWLYEKGILERVSFEYKDYPERTYFALDANDLKPYRREMEACPIDHAALAVRHIFDEPYTPCVYSGAIELGWTMSTYRDVDGCVGRSWECGLVKDLNTEGIYKVSKVGDEEGPKAAVTALFSQFDWNLTLPEQKAYRSALEHFNLDIDTNIENDHVKQHAKELIFCQENGKYLSDFDFWTRYETLCGEKMTYDEYCAVDRTWDGDPHDVKETDLETISEFRNALQALRHSAPHQDASQPISLTQQIQTAASRTATTYGLTDAKAKEHEL